MFDTAKRPERRLRGGLLGLAVTVLSAVKGA
jgi:hypothetical protein